MNFILTSCSSKLIALLKSFSKRCIVCLLKKDMKGKDVPLGIPKICKYKFQAQNKLDKKSSDKLNLY